MSLDCHFLSHGKLNARFRGTVGSDPTRVGQFMSQRIRKQLRFTIKPWTSDQSKRPIAPGSILGTWSGCPGTIALAACTGLHQGWTGPSAFMSGQTTGEGYHYENDQRIYLGDAQGRRKGRFARRLDFDVRGYRSGCGRQPRHAAYAPAALRIRLTPGTNRFRWPRRFGTFPQTTSLRGGS